MCWLLLGVPAHLYLCKKGQRAFMFRENRLLFTVEGEQFWHSRSVAVLMIPFFLVNEQVWIPLGLRSNKVDHSNKWAIPGGYLGWGESAPDAAIRECREEIGIELAADDPTISVGNICQPWFTYSDPDGDRLQNVTLRYLVAMRRDFLPDLAPQCDEVTEARWFRAIEAAHRTDLAFNHKDIIQSILAKDVLGLKGTDGGFGE